VLPVLEVGPWQISTYGLSFVIALLVAGPLACQRVLDGLDLPPRVNVWGPTLAVVGGFLGGWTVRLLPTLDHFVSTGQLEVVGGNSFTGMAVGIFVACGLFYRHKRVSLGRAFDLLYVPLPLGQAIGRLGCLAAGCCYGLPTGSWLGVALPDHRGLWLNRYPTQPIASATNLLIFVTLLLVERRGLRRDGRPSEGRLWPFDGFLFLLYLSLYGLQRFLSEFLRGDARPVLGPFTIVHAHTAAVFVLAAVLILRQFVRRSRSGDPS